MRLAVLGTAGYLPARGRQTMAFLLESAATTLLLDAGTGVARLAEPGIRPLLPPGRPLDVLLTHYHLDHVVGLSYLPGLASDRPVRIHAPAPPLTEFGPAEAFDRLLGKPLFPVPIARWPMPTEVIPFAGPELRIGDLDLRVRGQRHPGGSTGLRIGDALAYVTDTAMDPATEELARGVGLLLHEVWLSEDEGAAEGAAARSGHCEAGEVADLARRCGVGGLWLVHHHPRRSAEEIAAMASRMTARAGLSCLAPEEGRVYPIG